MTTKREQLLKKYEKWEQRTAEARAEFERSVAEERRLKAEIEATPTDEPGEPEIPTLDITPIEAAERRMLFRKEVIDAAIKLRSGTPAPPYTALGVAAILDALINFIADMGGDLEELDAFRRRAEPVIATGLRTGVALDAEPRKPRRGGT